MHHNTANLKIIEIFDAGPPGTCVTQGPTTKFGSSDHVQSIFSSKSWGFGAGMVIYNLVLVSELALGILGFDNTATCPRGWVRLNQRYLGLLSRYSFDQSEIKCLVSCNHKSKPLVVFCLVFKLTYVLIQPVCDHHCTAQWDSSVGFSKSYFFECKSGRNSIKVAEKWT